MAARVGGAPRSGSAGSLNASLNVYAALALIYLLVPIAIIIAVLVQRHAEPLQLHLERVHARALEGPVRVPGLTDALVTSIQIAGALHARSRPCSAR